MMENITFNTIPEVYFNYVLKELKDRLQISQSISFYIDDFAEIELNFGKSLIKIGNQLTIGNTNLTPTNLNVLNVYNIFDNIFKLSTIHNGKQHVGLQASLVNNITKVFPENIKSIKRKLNMISAKIISIVEEYRKHRQLYIKNNDKYIKLAIDTELAIKSKGAALIDTDSQDNSIKDDSFMNRSLSKMLGKNATNEKKLHDKVKELLRDLSNNEKTMLYNYNKLLSQYNEVINEINTSLQLLDEIEVNRLQFMSEGLNRLYYASELLISRLMDSLTSNIQQINNLDISIELHDFNNIIDELNNEITSYSTIDSNNQLVETINKVDKLIDYIDNYKNLFGNSKQTLLDSNTSSKLYIQSIHKVLDKHGYNRSPTSSTNQSINSMNCADLLATIESPTSRIGWESTVKLLSNLSTMYHIIVDLSIDVYVHPIDQITKSLDSTKKIILDKHIYYIKYLTTYNVNYNKTNSKLMKVQKEINEKRLQVKKLKDENDSSINDTSVDQTNYSTNATNSLPTNPSNNPNNSFEQIGSSFRSSSLSAVVGLETSLDKINRLENRLVLLQDEETNLLDQTKSVLSEYLTIYNSMKLDFKQLFENVQSNLTDSLNQIKSNLLNYLTNTLHQVDSSKSSLTDIKLCCDSIDIDRDIQYFNKYILAAVNTSDINEDSNSLLDIQLVDEFIPYHSPIIEDEKKLLKSLEDESSNNDTDESNQMDSNTAENDSQNNNQSNITTPNVVTAKLISSSSMTGPLTPNLKQTINNNGKEEVNELSKFGLTVHDKVIESFSCALYPKKAILTHGRMFITQSFLAFGGWPDTRLLIPLQSIYSIEKTNTMIYVPNALLIATIDKDEYFFGSFIDRDQCYSLLQSMSSVAKHLANLPDSKHVSVFGRNLVFGLQSNSTSLSSSSETVQNLTSTTLAAIRPYGNAIKSLISTDTTVTNALATVSPNLQINTNKESNLLLNKSVFSESSSYSPDSNDIDLSNQRIQPDIAIDQSKGSSPQQTTKKSSTVNNTPIKTSDIEMSEIKSSNTNIKINNEVVSDQVISTSPSIDLLSLFMNYGITALAQFNLTDSCTNDLWKSFWFNGDEYREFLQLQGDFNININEWKRLDNTNIIEDSTNTPFTHYRELTSLHPRTTMLMFGPKNAPSKQIQYLYIYPSNSSDDLSTAVPTNLFVLTVTQFDGIPMADVFKVLQYWIFVDDQRVNKIHCMIGLSIYYTKSTMFKSQIINGSKDELIQQCNKWNHYITTKLISYKQLNEIDSNTTISTINRVTITPSTSSSDLLKLNEITIRNESNDSKAITLSYIQIIYICIVIIIIQFLYNYLLTRRIVSLTTSVNSLTTILSTHIKNNQRLLDESTSRRL